MAVTPRIEIKQSQSLLMTPQLRQAINLLQMSNLELSELLSKELENNPFLEREDDRLADAEISSQPSIDDYPQEQQPNSEEDYTPDIDYDNSFDDYASDREGYDGNNDYSWSEYASSKNHNADEEFDFFEKKLSNKPSLYELLDQQISLNFATIKDKIIASRLSAFLDESGYFRGNIKDIATKLNLPVEDIENILRIMQGFEPSGIFTRDLKECLSIQLKDLNRLDPQMQKLLDNLELLGQRKFKELKKICAADDEDLATMIADIKMLNPKPAADYHSDTASNIIPDVFVRTNKQGDYLIELNNMSLPRLLINKEYYSEIKNLSGKNKEAKRYLKEQLGHAGFLMKKRRKIRRTEPDMLRNIIKGEGRAYVFPHIRAYSPDKLICPTLPSLISPECLSEYLHRDCTAHHAIKLSISLTLLLKTREGILEFCHVLRKKERRKSFIPLGKPRFRNKREITHMYSMPGE